MVTEADRTRSCMWAISRRFSLFLSSSLLRIRVKIRTKFELKNSDEFVRIRGYFLSENGHLAFLFYSPSKEEEEKKTCSLSGANAGTEVDRGWRKQTSDRRGGGRLAAAGPGRVSTAPPTWITAPRPLRRSRNLGRNLAQLVGCYLSFLPAATSTPTWPPRRRLSALTRVAPAGVRSFLGIFLGSAERERAVEGRD